ncbi:mucin-2 isoform X1 [Anastrepha ludens]|uniref:mucin-2 isoform X1 n=1 Tax=Anastrepha ludens TaxID=28586 RepID=UPI0023B1EB81|nr:mucin-2 isoform X1 [Anastrepha ludens]XP_053966396.1 mucin-2 isoform X1 [Anastrepha ludens]XP_053966397.1 mucin-2 isoform X1 [Anastrepha ludens]XP_053966398.1 mucin-2 isoform X1 [Anastrepha ludens]XP_053966399.1 mucin-2 isoform X1 [Anastrepha ludens]XP_053966400.1 mucin-2 isoform X1 [Anastrepha ludens]XP_053966401.1 mucin-2 isoform X1 [Anastrepha ludens]XP_053966402.1 mucin-2 isoform X1 [Anastrepha ludens]
MESMRRSEVNVSHHPNKVATNNSIVTESAKHNNLAGSSGSTSNSAASNLNKKLNTSSHKHHQYQNNTKHSVNRKVASSRNLVPSKSNSSLSSGGVNLSLKGCFQKPTGKTINVNTAVKESPSTTLSTYAPSSISSESKDTNFEYEDEWDIGGIPELLDDLDADIEKSYTAAQNLSKASNSGGGNSDIEANTIILKSVTKSTTSNKAIANTAYSDNLLGKRTSLSTTGGKFTSLPLPRSVPGSLSHFSGSSNEKIPSSVKSSRAAPIPPNSSKSSSKCAVGIAGKTINNSSLLPNIGSKYQETSGHKSYQTQQSTFKEHSTDGGYINKVVPIPNKSSSPLLPSSCVSAQAPLTCNSDSCQKGNTLTVSTFAGFSKGGNLVSSFTNSSLPTSSSVSPSNLSTALENDSLSNLSNCSASGMSSQSSGTSSNISSAGGGVGGGQGGSQSIGGSGSGKSNAKMSIDHQATLDKGLKMKIKRTKPGTKTSEAKHEIVKATEQQQQQNGSIGVNNPSNLDENNGLNTNSHSSSSSGASGSGGSNQNSGSGSGSSSNVANISGSNKKHLSNISTSNSNSQGNSHNSINSNSPASGSGSTGSGGSGQVTPQSNKRGSSGHRREKAKEKTTHSNRLIAEKNASVASEKEGLAGVSDKGITCHCNIDSTNGSTTSSCANHTCTRRSESANNSSIAVLTQRLSNTAGNSSATSGSVPPGVFTPSVGSPAGGVVTTAAVTATSLLSATSAASTTTPQSIGSTNAPNAPGTPGKDSTNCGNIKISSHIAAQLAAAAASTTFSNSVSITSANSLSGSSESKSNTSIVPVAQAKLMAPGMISATVHHTISVPANSSSSTTTASASSTSTSSNNIVVEDGIKSPPAKRAKHGDSSNASSSSPKEMVDICIGTSVGTITEPDCLGPCEPGTSVTLEGIVWHETEGGVLVVNVTWRGKTYVGTLLDCTRHDWAPPRFCDSPTEELDSRTPKGRGKRGRSAALTPDLSNFTETRSSIYFSHAQVHSKLRNGTTKGGRGASRTAISATSTASTTTITSSSSSGNGGGATPSTSPTAFLPPRSEKRKSKDESPSPINGDSECTTNVANASGIPISASGGGLATQPQSLVNPVTGLNVQISTKKCKTASPCAISPVLLECPEQDCSKKYKHANGLRYHQSHAHGSACSMDEDSLQLPEEPPTPTSSPVPPAQSTRAVTPTVAEGAVLTSGVMAITSPVTPPISTSTIPASSSESSSLPAAVLPPSSQTAIPETADSETVVGGGSAPSAASTISSSAMNASASVTNASPSSTSAPIGGILTVSSAQALLPQSQQQHPVAGGSITAGISGQLLSQQQQQQSLGMSNASNLPALLPEQSQTTSLPQQGGSKSGVLRFGPQSDVSNSGAPPSILALQQQVSQGTSPQAGTLAGQSPQRAAAQLTTNSESLQPPHQTPISTYTSSSTSAGQNLQGISLSTKNSPVFAAVKQKKCRKSPGPVEYDGVVTRDNVQSPAYSDISDDSTPVGEQDILDKSQPKLIDLPNKKQSDLGAVGIGSGSQTIPPLGGYGMYQFYQQQQYLVPPPSSDQQPSQTPNKGLLPSTLVQPSLTLPASQSQQQASIQSSHLMQQQQPQQQQQQSPLLTDYNNKSKDPPLDLITKSSQQQQGVAHQQQMQSQDGAGNQKDTSSGQLPQPAANLSNVGPPNNGLPPGMGAMQSLGTSGVGPGGLPTPTPSKPLSHFYPFNYMAPGYPYNVEPNYGPVSIVASDDTIKLGNHGNLSSSQPQNTAPPHPNSGAIKDERVKESPSPHECSKQIPQQQQLVSTKLIKSEPMAKQEIKQEHNPGAQPQQQQPPQQQQQPQQPHALHPKDLQGLGSYPNIYQRHPMTLAAQHLSREEELRRYYILSDEQRRQSAVAALRAVQAQNPSNSGPPGSLQAQVMNQHKEDSGSSSQHQPQMSIPQQQQHQQSQKSKSQTCSTNVNANTVGSSKATNLTKEVSKQKQEEEVKIKQEGQKPTMETQGPPPPPTSQYFLHPSYIAPAPFSFDPNHPMYRNVLMSAAGPYNAAPYHLPIPRYHAPEDLSRNTGTKALDALHHAASQYYTTHKIHELSERALKSPTSGNNSGPGGAVKVSVSSPNVGIQQQAVNTGGVSGPGSGTNVGPNAPNSGSHLTATNQSSGGSGIPLNLQPPPTGMSGPPNKSDVLNQKVLSGPGGPGSNLAGAPINIDSHKQQGGPSGPNSGGSIGGAPPGGNSATADSRSPPPQRHVHTHHHTHVGLGYPMYTAPYGAAVLASQQAAAVAVINPFPPGPTK